jgi:DNA-binding transcriptional LysR family regulator
MTDDRWLGVELRHLVALATVAADGSFVGAARKLGYTQSAISQQVASLERIIGERLIERRGGSRAVSLTTAGQLVLRHAESIVASLAAARADIATLQAGVSGVLRVGTYQSVGAHFLPQVLKGVAVQWEAVEIHLHDASSDIELLEMVEVGTLDLTFATLPPPDGPFETLRLIEDPYVLLAHRDSPVALASALPKLSEIAQLPLIGYSSCRMVDDVAAHLRLHGLEPRIALRTNDNGTLHGLVAADVGYALVPELSVYPNTDVMVLPVEGAPLVRTVGLVWHSSREPTGAMRAFIRCAERIGMSMGGPSDVLAPSWTR